MYLLPSLFTIGNLFCGYACVVYAMRGDFEFAAILIGIAFVVDSIDGSIARLTRSGSSSQTSANVAGKRTSVRKRRSGQSPLSQSRSAPAV